MARVADIERNLIRSAPTPLIDEFINFTATDDGNGQVANRLYLSPMLIPGPMDLAAIYSFVSDPLASGCNFMMALYQLIETPEFASATLTPAIDIPGRRTFAERLRWRRIGRPSQLFNPLLAAAERFIWQLNPVQRLSERSVYAVGWMQSHANGNWAGSSGTNNHRRSMASLIAPAFGDFPEEATTTGDTTEPVSFALRSIRGMKLVGF